MTVGDRPLGLPPEISFGEVTIGDEPAARDFQFCVEGEALVAENASVDAPWVYASAMALQGAVHVSVAADAPSVASTYTALLTLATTTDSTRVRTFDVPVVLHARPSVEVVPARVHLGGIRPGQTARKLAVLQIHDPRYRLGDVTSRNEDWLTFEIEPAPQRGREDRFNLIVVVNGAPDVPRLLEGSLAIDFQGPRPQRIDLPVEGVVLR